MYTIQMTFRAKEDTQTMVNIECRELLPNRPMAMGDSLSASSLPERRKYPSFELWLMGIVDGTIQWQTGRQTVGDGEGGFR